MITNEWRSESMKNKINDLPFFIYRVTNYIIFFVVLNFNVQRYGCATLVLSTHVKTKSRTLDHPPAPKTSGDSFLECLKYEPEICVRTQ